MENQYSNSEQSIFIRKFDPEEATWYYIHFESDWAVRQIVQTPKKTFYFSETHLYDEESLHGLTDQPFSKMDPEIQKDHFITRAEFEKKWKPQQYG